MPTSTSTSSSQRKAHVKTYTFPPFSSTSSSSSSPSPSSSSSTSTPYSSPSPSRFTTYTPTTLSNYHRRTHHAVEGLPGPTYFSSGQSKTHRRREYIEPPTHATPPSHFTNPLSAIEGKELVHYRSAPHPPLADCSDDEDDEDGSLYPSDSISQVSYPTSSPYGTRRGRQGRRDSGFHCSRSGGGSTFSSLSTFQSEQVFDGTRGCYLVERRPRASATAR